MIETQSSFHSLACRWPIFSCSSVSKGDNPSLLADMIICPNDIITGAGDKANSSLSVCITTDFY